MKRTKNQGCVIVVEAQISALIYDFASKRFILFTPEMLILSVIFYEASDKTLALDRFKTTLSSLNQKFIVLIYLCKLRY